MHPYHKRFIFLQIFILLLLIAMYFVSPKFYTIAVFPTLCVFFLTEIGVLEYQRKENKDVMIYRKSCWFGIADTISVLLFVVLTIFSGIYFFQGKNTLVPYAYLLYIYIAIRKYYILKHYSYEK